MDTPRQRGKTANCALFSVGVPNPISCMHFDACKQKKQTSADPGKVFQYAMVSTRLKHHWSLSSTGMVGPPRKHEAPVVAT